MNNKDVLACSDYFGNNFSVMNFEGIKSVLNSRFVSEKEKKYFINLFCINYRLLIAKDTFETEISSIEEDRIQYNMMLLIARAKLGEYKTYNQLYNKYMLYNDDTGDYLSKDNTIKNCFGCPIEEFIPEMKPFSSKSKAKEELNILNLDKKLNVNKFTDLTTIDCDIDKINSSLDFFKLDFFKDILSKEFVNIVCNTNLLIA